MKILDVIIGAVVLIIVIVSFASLGFILAEIF